MKNLLIFVVVIALAAAGIVYFSADTNGPSDPSPTPTVSPSVSATVSRSVAPKPSATRTPTPTPTPGVGTSEAKIHDVAIEDFRFGPATLTVKRGDVIVFRNKDSAPHTATALNGSFDSGNLSQNMSWTLATANLAAGTYEYKCALHPSMRGTIVIQ